MSDNPDKKVDEFNLVGKARRRVDARAKVTGQARFADDLVLPRMLHCKLLRSRLPHAKIKSVTTDKARAAAGVRLILTGYDTPVPYGILPVSHDEHPLCTDKVRFVGDPIAAVIADSEEEATAALDLIHVDLEPLTTISDAEEALRIPEPRIHDYGDEGNLHKKVAFDFGDVDEALRNSERVFEDVFFYEGNTHLAIEQHATLAAIDDAAGPDGRLTVWSSTQTPHYLHRALAKALELDPARVRVVAIANGGGFGGKSDPFNHEIVVAKAALMLGRPVKICLTREEVFYCHRGRHPVLMKLRTGVSLDGKIKGMELQTLLDGGAYGSYGVASTFYTGALQTVTYKVPRYRFQGCRAFTNKPPCGPKRGHGTPQPRFGLEVQLDKIATALKLDPADLRLQQLVEPRSLTANYMSVETIGLGECIRRVVDGSGFRARRSGGKLPTPGDIAPVRGLGLACSSYLSGAGLPIYWNDLPQSGVQLQLDRSGRVTAFCGATEIGQGSDDVLALCVAEILGIEIADIKVLTGDTDLTPVDLGSYSSRVTLMMGNAAIEAATRARDLVAKAVSDKMGVPVEKLRFAERRVTFIDDPARVMSWQDAVILAEAKHGTLGTTGSYKPPRSAAKYKGGGVGPTPTYSYSAAVVEVEVDPVTGWYDVIKVWIGHDIGRALNPPLTEGQVIGSVYMGLGEALMEESTFRRLPPKLSGALVHKFPSMLEYKSPSTMEMPPVEVFLVEDPDSRGPFGAKEVGQGPLLPMMPAIANAIFDAVGVRVDEVPITAEKIARALDAATKGRPARVGPTKFPAVAWPEALKIAPPWEGGDGTASNDRPKKERMARPGEVPIGDAPIIRPEVRR